MYHPITNYLAVADRYGDIIFQLEDLVRYSGKGGLIGSGIVLRLLSRAFADLSPNQPPIRSELFILSSYPGSDVVDGIELVTKAVSNGRYILDKEKAPKDAPPTPQGGCLYFEVLYHGRSFAYTFSPKIFDLEWFNQEQKNQKDCESEEERAKYIQYMFSILGKLVNTANPFLRVESCQPDIRLKALEEVSR